MGLLGRGPVRGPPHLPRAGAVVIAPDLKPTDGLGARVAFDEYYEARRKVPLPPRAPRAKRARAAAAERDNLRSAYRRRRAWACAAEGWTEEFFDLVAAMRVAELASSFPDLPWSRPRTEALAYAYVTHAAV